MKYKTLIGTVKQPNILQVQCAVPQLTCVNHHFIFITVFLTFNLNNFMHTHISVLQK